MNLDLPSAQADTEAVGAALFAAEHIAAAEGAAATLQQLGVLHAQLQRAATRHLVPMGLRLPTDPQAASGVKDGENPPPPPPPPSPPGVEG